MRVLAGNHHLPGEGEFKFLVYGASQTKGEPSQDANQKNMKGGPVIEEKDTDEITGHTAKELCDGENGEGDISGTGRGNDLPHQP
ncbi:MAG: hypothetical protein KGR98_08200 [Verrucomicrobia bacterium]|nr:hypothetical protein [Verrucomicrobiota bacterium]